MADADTQVTIEQLHAAIESAVRGKFPDFKTVEFYRVDETERIQTPACVMEMTECEPYPENSDGGTGKLSSLLRFEARIIMLVRDKVAAIEVRKAAVAFAVWLHQLGRFPGAITDAIQVIATEADEWAPAHGGFVAWRVEWVVPALLGEDAWANEGGVVPEAFYSFSPDIGEANVGSYKVLAGES